VTGSEADQVFVGINRRRAALLAVPFGVLTAAAVVGLATGGNAVGEKLLFLIVAAPLFGLALRNVIRRRPVLILSADELIDVSRRKSLRWNAMTEIRIREWRGLFGVYHELICDGEPPSAASSSEIKLRSIDGLSMTWEQIADEVERRLPSTVRLRRVGLSGH